MASKQLTIVVQPRGKPIKGLTSEITISNLASTAELYNKIADASNFSVHRLRITKGSDGSLVPNSESSSVDSTGLRDRSVVNVKDLGPQLGWRFVYIVEYLGPLLIHPLFYYLRPYIYKTSAPPSELQTLSMYLLTLHFFKREIETIFIHRFSLATMPAFNIFKNCGHYWLFAGFNIAYWTYAPNALAANPQSILNNDVIKYIGLALFAIGELGNLNAHLVLMNLRKPGSTERGIPKGLGFNLVTCPNYMFESIAWFGIILINQSLATVFFVIMGVGQMAVWAKKRERRYRSEFPDKYKKKRYVILPGIY